MKKIKYVVIIFVCVFLVGCGRTHSNQTVSEITNIKNKMIKELKNYTYSINYDISIDEEDFTIELECKNDLENMNGYCLLNNYTYVMEKYIDYGNRKYYYRHITKDNKDTGWMELNRYYNKNINYSFNILDSIINVKFDKDNNVYTGVVTDLEKIDILLLELNDRYEMGEAKDNYKKVNASVYVDDNNYIYKTVFELEKDKNVEILYKDFNSTDSVVLPDYLSN